MKEHIVGVFNFPLDRITCELESSSFKFNTLQSNINVKTIYGNDSFCSQTEPDYIQGVPSKRKTKI